jgi:Zn-dependent metalloprotease
MSRRRCSIFCILPPHILEHVAKNGREDEMRRWAVDILSVDHAVRAARVQNAASVAAVPAALRGNLLAVTPEAEAKITIYDAEGHERISGPVLRGRDRPQTDDVAANEAYDGLEATFDFYYQAYQRNSIDDAGMPLDGTVHYGDHYPNAFWDGHEMLFGDGDGVMFDRFTIDVDIMGHELTHGVTEATAQLQYWEQSGALNESLSDVFGSLVKQHQLGQTAEQADWLIGDRLVKAKDQALRSMKAPGTAYDNPEMGTDPQPAHMRDFVVTTRDHAGVHVNSGIPNKAFYNVASALGGNAWERAGRLWYSALLDPRLKPTSRFLAFARATARAARRLHPGESEVEVAVREGWREVGIDL